MSDLKLGLKDPATGNIMSEECWNFKHFRTSTYGCSGWLARGSATPCECYCHAAPRRGKAKPKIDPSATMDIMETGCGTIEIT